MWGDPQEEGKDEHSKLLNSMGKEGFCSCRKWQGSYSLVQTLQATGLHLVGNGGKQGCILLWRQVTRQGLFLSRMVDLLLRGLEVGPVFHSSVWLIGTRSRFLIQLLGSKW